MSETKEGKEPTSWEQRSGWGQACGCLPLQLLGLVCILAAAEQFRKDLGSHDPFMLAVGLIAAAAALGVIFGAVYQAKKYEKPLEVDLGASGTATPVATPEQGPSEHPEICPFCQTEIAPAAERVVCSSCRIPHHRECWQENGGCTTYGCSSGPRGSE